MDIEQINGLIPSLHQIQEELYGDYYIKTNDIDTHSLTCYIIDAHTAWGARFMPIYVTCNDLPEIVRFMVRFTGFAANLPITHAVFKRVKESTIREEKKHNWKHGKFDLANHVFQYNKEKTDLNKEIWLNALKHLRNITQNPEKVVKNTIYQL